MMRIRELRMENGLTQKELGEKIQSTSKNVWAYERGLSTPPLDVLVRLADYFKCSIDYLVGRSDDFGNIVLAMPNEQSLSVRELSVVQSYRRLPRNYQQRAQEYLQSLTELTKKENEAQGKGK